MAAVSPGKVAGWSGGHYRDNIHFCAVGLGVIVHEQHAGMQEARLNAPEHARKIRIVRDAGRVVVNQLVV